MATAPATDQRALLKIADIDKNIARLERENTKHPLREKLGAIMNAIAACARSLEEATQEVTRCTEELSQAESSTSEIQKTIDDKERKLNSGQGLTSRDLLTLQDEITGLRQRLEEASEREFEALESLEVAENKVANIQEEMSSMKESLLQDRAQLEDEISVILAEQDALKKQRTEGIALLNEDLVRIYERARSRGGYSVISMKPSGATDVGVALSPVEVAQIKSLPEEEIYLSEDYDCIVVRDWD